MDREANNRHGRDAAGIGPYARERETLVPLRSLESWSVSEGEPDIRGWEIRTVSGRQLGTVNDLLIDPDANEVVMIDADLPGRHAHTFVPIRIVQIDRARRIILMDSADFTAPESDSDEVAPPRVDAATPRTVRYPDHEREVPADRPITADAAPPPEAMPPESSLERRRGERRRIDRLSTDI